MDVELDGVLLGLLGVGLVLEEARDSSRGVRGGEGTGGDARCGGCGGC